MSLFGLKFSQMILHTETSKLMYNWPFLFVALHKPTLLPSTFNIVEARFFFFFFFMMFRSMDQSKHSNQEFKHKLKQEKKNIKICTVGNVNGNKARK